MSTSPRSTAPLATLLACIALGCGGAEPEPAVRSDEPIPVSVITVGEADLSTPVVATGTLAARDEVALAFKLGGVVESVGAEAGQRVESGTVLARLAQAEIEATVAKAQQAVGKAKRDAERARRLSRDSVTSTMQREDAETMLQLAEQDLRVALFNANYAEVRAPSAGVVLRRLASPGAMVAPGTPIVLFRPEGNGVLLRAGLSDRDAARVRAGDRAVVRFDGAPDRSYSGTVTRVAAGANPLSGTYDAEIDLEASARTLPSGLVGRAEIRTVRRMAKLALPLAALIEADGDSARVFVADSAGGTARLRRIRIGAIGGGMVPVLGGLTAGELVVLAGGAYVTDGGPIRVVRDAPAGAEKTP